MARRVAVVTDAISPEFYFPVWHRYYADQFGADNLYVITQASEVDSFKSFKLGGLTPIAEFNNTLRIEIVNRVVGQLLSNHDVVVRVDTDEFLVADPVRYPALREYVTSMTQSHITAYGFNVIPDRNQPPLDLNRPILFYQRNVAYPYDALCKTCVTAQPMRWSPGFHFCSEVPLFDALFLFHLKLADIDLQVKIGSKTASYSNEAMFIEYHKTTRETLEARIANLWALPRVRGLDALYRREYIKKFLAKVSYSPNYGGIYHGGSFEAEPVLVELTREFGNVI